MKRVISVCLLSLGILFAQQEDQKRAVPKLGKLAKRCGKQIKWIKKFKKAKTKAIQSGRLILAYIYRIKRSPMEKVRELEAYMDAGPWVNPDIVELVRRKFVTAKVTGSRRLSRGLVPRRFYEPGLVFFTPEQKPKVLHKLNAIYTFNDDFILHVLRWILRNNPKYNIPSPSLTKAQERLNQDPQDSGLKLELAQEYIKEGQYEQAHRLLAELEGIKGERLAQVYYTWATLFRRQRRADKALKLIQKAQQLPLSETLKADLLAEEALIALKQSKYSRAEQSYKRLLKVYPQAHRADEAMFYLGAIYYLSAREKQAKAIWRRAARGYPDSSWGWKSAANLVRLGRFKRGPLVSGFEQLSWPPQDIFDHLPAGTTRGSKPSEALQAVKRGVSFLLERQRSNGAWRDHKYDFGERVGGIRSMLNVDMAVTALCATALLSWRGMDPRIEPALDRAEDYMLEDKNISWRDRTEILWAHIYRLFYFSRRLASIQDQDKRRRLRKRVRILVNHVKAIQQRSGIWRHEYENPFASASALLALYEAKVAGAKLSARMIRKGLRALKSCRARNGTFSYGYGRGPGARIRGAAGRMPLCELALYHHGKSSKKRVKKALRAFFKNLKRLERVRRYDYHADRFMNGGFYFFYDLYPASEAILVLDEKDREKYLKRLLSHLLEIQEMDGSWVDSHELGKSYGTAMALLTLKNCLQ
jgi:tetratricopeptide (TPR) repeat protein